ncbi:unnamed protein product [Clonostachys rosea]|uniref:Uncharacterized protein n=1 Tax=Bionectria ochroleuca TaxID=29856 RepID=A0ABY6U456_BIOOC|nr:unnamed protein product [Clonostachys rosea]
MDGTTQRSNLGGSSGPYQEINIDDLVARHGNLVTEFSKKIGMMEESMYTYDAMRTSGTPAPMEQREHRYQELRDETRAEQTEERELEADSIRLKTLADRIDQQITDIERRLQEIQRRIQELHPEVEVFNFHDAEGN